MTARFHGVLLPLMGAALTVMGGCSRDVSSKTVPMLVVPNEARLAQLKGGSAINDGSEDRDAIKLGAAGFSTDADFAEFIKECDLIQPAGEPAPAHDDGSTGAYGEVYRGKSPVTGQSPVKADNIFRQVEGNPEYLDPNKISESSGTNIAMQMFETLLVLAPGNTPPVPGLAERYDVSEDGKTYTFHIRRGVMWSDGVPITAHDVAYSWRRGLSPELGSRNAQQLWFIKGGRAYNNSENPDPASVAIEVVDDHTLKVGLNARTPFFPDLLTYIAYAPVPRHAIEKHGEKWIRPENIVVSGAFIMTEWKQRDSITMKRNTRYWDVANVKLDGVIFHSSDNEQNNVVMYKTGKAHWIKPLPAEQIRRAIEAGREDLHIDQQMCTYYYVFRTDRPPFDHPLLRQAINLAVDKERLTRHVLASFQPVGTHLVPDMFQRTLNYVPPEGDVYDPARAKELMAEAGYPGGKGLPPIEIIYNTFESHKRIAAFVQRNLKENLGLDVTVQNMEWKSLLKRAHAGDFQISRTSWCADYPDPLTFLTVFHGDGENNYAAYKNPAYDKLLGQINDETDRRKRNILMCAAEMGLNRDMPVLPFYFYTRSYLLRPEVRGFLPQYQDHHMLKYVSLDSGVE